MPAAALAHSEAPVKLLLTCVECGATVRQRFDNDKLSSNDLYADCQWFLSLIDPAAQLLAPLCKACSEKVYSPEILKVARASLMKAKGKA